jgi:hypothetical protein
MSRKRKSDQTTRTETPSATLEPPAVESATAVAEPPVADPIPEATFADRVGPKKEWVPAPDPFPFATDKLAGVRVFYSTRDRQVAIKFGDGSPEQKPSQAVIDKMKESGWRWKPADRIWAKPYGPESAMTTRIDAEKLYQEVRQMIRAERGIDSGAEVPF